MFLLTRGAGLIGARYIVRIGPLQIPKSGRSYHDITYLVGEDVHRATADEDIVTEFLDQIQ
jgi:hypothetical protein